MFPTMEEVIQHIAKGQHEVFLEKNELLSGVQSEFRKDHSRETSLNRLIVEWKEEIEDICINYHLLDE